MKTYTCPKDLEQFGFRCLTGEACGLGLRLLFDVNDKAKATVEKALGLCPGGLILPESWNGGDTDAGSLLMDRHLCCQVAIFSMLDCGCREVWQKIDPHLGLIDELYGLFGSDLELAKSITETEHFRIWKYRGTANDRNVHVMSGRTV